MTDSNTALVLRSDTERVTTLTLNRPDKLNALAVPLFRELRAHVEALKTDESIGCVILRGAGKCFSAGNDLASIGQGEAPPSRGWHSETLRMMEKLPQPVIAAVHGHCYTGALEVALACDFIIASDNARFGDTHAKWALTPVWGMSQRLPRRIGVPQAKRMMFTAAVIDAREARRIGLVDECGDLASLVAGWAERIVGNSRHTNAAMKRLLRETEGMALGAGLAHEFFRNPGPAPDLQQRLARFTRAAHER